MSEDEQKKIFSRNLNRILSERRKTQKEVADAIGVSPQTFNTWCQGIALPRMGKVQLLADYFKVNKSDLIEPYESSAAPSINSGRDALLSLYDSFNDAGKEELLRYARLMDKDEEYKKDLSGEGLA